MDCVVKYMGQVTEQELARTGASKASIMPICDADNGDAQGSAQRQQVLTLYLPNKSYPSH